MSWEEQYLPEDRSLYQNCFVHTNCVATPTAVRNPVVRGKRENHYNSLSGNQEGIQEKHTTLLAGTKNKQWISSEEVSLVQPQSQGCL